jgi:dihydroflavonol-4-reductase
VEGASSMRILITGGTGFVGRATIRVLTGAGHEVRAIVRDRAAASTALAGLPVEFVDGDPGDPAAIAPASADRDAVIHVAATYQYVRGEGGSMASNATLARTVLEAAGAAGVGRIVDVSSLIVFALGAERLDETAPLTQAGDPGWSDPYLRSKVEAEVVGRELEAAGLPRVTVYPGTVIGPDDAGRGPSGLLLQAILDGGAIPDTRSPWVDVRDIARAIALALDAPIGGRYGLTSGVPTHRALAALVDELTGRHPRRMFLGAGWIRRLARLNDLAGGHLGPLPEADRLDFLLDNAKAVDTTRSERELGLGYRSLRETVADTIRWWATNGVIGAGSAGRLASGPGATAGASR